MSAKAFTEDLQRAIREYTPRLDITPVVKVTLADGASHYVMRARIMKFELLDEYPGGRGAFGFQSPPEA